MRRAALAGWTPKRLRLVLGLFFLALAVPSGLLIHQAFSHLKWAAFRQHQLLAEELAARIDGRFGALVRTEQGRAVTDYGFLVTAGEPPTAFLQRSPLSQYPVPASPPGLVGYFEVDPAGALTTPVVPAAGIDATAYGVAASELADRAALRSHIRQILTENRLMRGGQADVVSAPAARRDEERMASADEEAPPAPLAEATAVPQAAFDRLREAAALPKAERKRQARNVLGRVEDLRLDDRYQQSALPAGASNEQAGVKGDGELAQEPARPGLRAKASPAGDRPATTADQDSALARGGGIRLFGSDVEPFQVSLLESGHFVLFRSVWRDRQRYIQGALLEQEGLLRGIVEAAFRETVLAQTTDLLVAWRGDVLSALSSQAARSYLASADELHGALLLRSRLSSPLDGMELLFSVTALPAGAGAGLLGWLAATLVGVLCGGFWLLYRLGLRQIALAGQQQDFVSAVSHELRTPLTSIRMYGELLREGWAPEEKKPAYYAYIHDESERLGRLIDNVLQLARMTRNDLRLNPRPVAVGELMELVRSKVVHPVERAGFTLDIDCAEPVAAMRIEMDPDAFSQILLNLVDNAVKFSAQAERKAVEIRCNAEGRDALVVAVRDYGPGVPTDQLRKIFRLFYRVDGGLSRETVGTGIGLALVRQLTEAMGGTVDVVNREPGAEFRVRLSAPAAGTS